jgi:hypothetical protein
MASTQSEGKGSPIGGVSKITHLILLGVALVSCSRPVGRSTTIAGPPAAVASSLAGESAGAARDRYFDKCMASLGEVGIPGVVEAEGTTSTGFAYPVPSEGNRHWDECQRRADVAVPIPEMTADDRRVFHARFAKVLECVQQQGLDPGTMISVEEYVANGAPNGLTSKWPQLSQDPSFMERFIKCSDGIPPIKQGS